MRRSLLLLLSLALLRPSNGFVVSDRRETGSSRCSTTATTSSLASTKQRWGNLDGKIRERMGRARDSSSRHPQKESKEEKKRRQLLFMQQKQAEKKKAARIYRPLNFKSRLPLSQLQPGIPIMGVVISLTNFGAYVDVGSETDGLLHISQLSADTFITHPRQVLTPGETIVVTVRSVNPQRRKLHLTLLPPDVLAVQDDYAKRNRGDGNDEEDADDDDRIPLSDLQVDDELWGQILRVTQFGAYVEVGCAVQGFLHFMDHPGWCDGKEPREFMQRGDRIRVWVLDVDEEQQRVKLTAVRPEGLPGPRRDIVFSD